MTEATALVPLRQQQVDFYGDQIVAALVPMDGQAQPTIYVPVRPICDYLGVDWSAQRRRIVRDAVLSKNARGVAVTATPGGTQEMLCLPIEFLHGWLFGLNADRVKPELREKVIRYQEECFRVLWQAFQAQALAALGATRPLSPIEQVRELGLSLARFAEEHLALEARVSTTEERLDQAAVVVGGLVREVADIKRKVAPGTPITEEQAGEIQQAVKALAMLLTEADPSKNHFQSIWSELNRRMGVAGYRSIPAARYGEVMAFLEDWRRRLAGPNQHHEGD